MYLLETSEKFYTLQIEYTIYDVGSNVLTSLCPYTNFMVYELVLSDTRLSIDEFCVFVITFQV